jgi:hypothetical protein
MEDKNNDKLSGRIDQAGNLVEKTGKTFNDLLPSLDKYIKGAFLLILLLLTLTFCGTLFLIVWRIQEPEKFLLKKDIDCEVVKLDNGKTIEICK